MFLFSSLPRSDRPVLVDYVRAEFERRILFAPPGPLDPQLTYEQVHAELTGTAPVSVRDLAPVSIGLLPPALAALAQLLDDDVEVTQAGFQPAPESAEAEGFQAPAEAHPSTENAETKIKLESYKPAPAFLEETETCLDDEAENPLVLPSFGTVSLKSGAHSGRQRAHKNDVPWQKKRFVQGHKVSKTLSRKQREWVDDALLRMKLLLGTGALVCVTMKPEHLDALGPVERMRYWKPFVNNFRSYRRGRCKALKKKLSWWVVRCVWVRESNPDDDLGEHFHWILMFPNAEEAEHFIAHVRDTDDYEGWGKNTHAMRIDAEERMVGGKLSSFFNYVLKAVHPQSRFADSTIGWKPSGALVGRRYFITNNLKSAAVIAETEIGLATLKRVRKEKKRAAFVRRAQKARAARGEGMYSYADVAPLSAQSPAIDPALPDAPICLSPIPGAPVLRDVPRCELDADARAEPGAVPVVGARDEIEVQGVAPPLPVDVSTTPGDALPAAADHDVPARPSCPPSSERSSPASVTPFGSSVHGRAAIPRRPRRGGSPSTGYTGIPPPGVRGWSTSSAARAGTSGRARAPPPRPCAEPRLGGDAGQQPRRGVPVPFVDGISPSAQGLTDPSTTFSGRGFDIFARRGARSRRSASVRHQGSSSERRSLTGPSRPFTFASNQSKY